MNARARITVFATTVIAAASVVVLAAVFVVVRNFPVYPLTEQNLPTRDAVLTAMIGVAGTVTAFVVVFGCCASWLLAHVLLRPLDRLRRAAMSAADGDLTQRVGIDGEDEFGRLAGAFDTMLDRLQEAVESQRRFAANAAHELRTPLAIVKTLAEVAASTPVGDRTEALRRIAATNDRAIETCIALLELADVNAIALRRGAEAARDLIADAVESVPHSPDRPLHVRAADVDVLGDVRLVRQAVRNLVDNAFRHGTGGPVVITASVTDRELVIRVENDGRPLDPTTVDRLREPFLREVGRIRDDTTSRGHGLGLAIVDRVAAVHGGSLHLAARDEGGLIAELALPARDQQDATPTQRPTC